MLYVFSVCHYACLVNHLADRDVLSFAVLCHSSDVGLFSFLCVVTLALSVIQLMVVCFPVCVWLRLSCQSFN